MKIILRFALLVLLVFTSINPSLAQWTAVNTGLTNTSVWSLAVSGTNLFAGTYGGVFLSTNNGTSWNAVNNGLTYTFVGALAVSGTNLFAGCDYGVFLSTNNGTSWTAVNTGLTEKNVLSLAVSGTNLFAGTINGVFLSTNNGTNWTAVNTGFPNSYVRALAVSGTDLFAGTDSYGVFLSTNNGTSWIAMNNGLTNTNVHAFAVSGTSLFAGTGNGVFLSTNNGATWTASITHGSINAFVTSGSYLFVAIYPGNIFLSMNNGASWAAVNDGLTTDAPSALAASNSNLFAGNSPGGVWSRSLSDWVFLHTPTNGLGGITLPATFKWKMNPQALSYAFQISTDAGFSNFAVNQYTTDTNYTVSNLQLATVYYWRVRAENTTWASEWGVGMFTTKLTSAPQLSNPSSGATLVSVTPTLSWSPVVSTASYTLQISTRLAFDTLVFSIDTTSTSIVSPQLQRSTTYYWRVRAQTIGDTTAWSSVSSFTTVPNAPNQITLAYPDSSKQDAYQNDWLTWLTDTTAISYLIQISQSPLITTIYDSATVKSAGYRSRNKVFTTGSTYFWRVRGSNIGGDGQFSELWSFRVGSGVRVPITLYSSSNLDYGRVKVSQYKDTVVTITNNGNDTLKISNISSSVGSFSVRPTAGTLPPGQSFVDTIRFAPAVIGMGTSSVIISSNSSTSTDTIKVSGFGYGQGVASIKASNIALGSIRIGQYRDTTLAINNIGNDTLTISDILTTTSTFTATSGSIIIAGGDSTVLTVRFKPTAFGTFTDTVMVVSDGGTLKVGVSGSSPIPTLTSLKTSIAYSNVAKGTTKNDTVKIVNGSINTLTVDSIYTKTSAFTVDKISGTIGTDTLRVVISFTPTGITSYTDTLYLLNNSATPLVKILLSGNSPTPSILCSPRTIAFGDVGIYDSSKTILRVINSSVNILTIDSIYTYSTAFTPLSSSSHATNKDTATITIRFKPITFGVFLDTLFLRNNSDTTLFKIPLSGNTPTSSISITPSNIAFGTVKKDSTKQLLFSITNSSISVLQIDSLWTNTKYFNVTHMLAIGFFRRGDTAKVTIRFTPDSTRSFTDTMFIANNSPVVPFKVPLSGNGTLTSVENKQMEIPTVFSLAQNYPNPFNPSTTISFSLPSKSFVSLKIFDLIGREVSTVVSEELSAGRYAKQWIANGMPSGVYFYRLQAGSFTETKKLVLLR